MHELALSRFQSAFAAALFGDLTSVDPVIAELAAHPAFAIYRNGVMKAAVDALQANYPAVGRLVGSEWLRAVACEYVRNSPPRSPMLVAYGASFADFLSAFEPAANLPYLADVARLDRMWTEAHIAASATPLEAAALAALSEDCLAHTVLDPHPAARWAWFHAMPIYTLWTRNRSTEEFDANIDWTAEGALITRPASTVIWRPLDRAGCAFLDTCRAGRSVVQAVEAVLATDPATDLGRLLQTLTTTGALCAPRSIPPDLGERR